MKKVFAIIAALALTINLAAQTNHTEAVDFNTTDSHGIKLHDCFLDEEVIVTPDSLHLFFQGCSPHGEIVTVTNHTSEELVVNRCYAENFHVECLYEGENIAETGMIVPIGETICLNVYASPTGKAEQDHYGTLLIDTDFGVFTIVIYYESALSATESENAPGLFPNPADKTITLVGDKPGKVVVYDMLGQPIDEFDNSGSPLGISTSSYPNGIYFVRTTDGTTKRFVIAH
ncbi:MAG: T9SS type A sorting domain-containing protein [Bacteroidales bacterium]|nr:T9SS type A sorting domain-containing protein [Bacteroidales bacterium]